MFQNRGPKTYMPIGHYLFMKKNGQSDLHVFEFEESIEISEHQWVGQILVKSLEILGDLKVRNLKNEAENSVTPQIKQTFCSSCRLFDQWNILPMEISDRFGRTSTKRRFVES